jgi:hypothetical protein
MTNKEVQNITLESLRDWFKKEKWVRISSSGNIAGPCGTSKNKKNPDRCLPKAKAQSLSKAERAATARKKKKAGSKGKTVVKNTKKATVKKEGLWANINAKKKAGKKSSHKNSNAYKDAKKAGNALKQETANPQDGKAAPYGSGYKKVTKEDITNLVVGTIAELQQKESVLQEDDRCTRLAKQKYDTWPSAYASGAVVRCRRGEIWKEYKTADPQDSMESVNEATPIEKIFRKIGWAGDGWTPQDYARQIKNLSDKTLKIWYDSAKSNIGIPNTPLAFQQKLTKIEMEKRGLL